MVESITNVSALSPFEFRKLVRSGAWSADTLDACHGYGQANLVVLPKEYALEFMIFAQRNPGPCPILDITEAGDPCPRRIAPEVDVRTDIPRYRVIKDGSIVDEPTDITAYWQDDLIAFLLGCGHTFDDALRAANVSWRRYGVYRTQIPCVPAGRFHGNMAVQVCVFPTTSDAIRAIQVSSRYIFNHGAPIHIGDPARIGISDLGQPDPLIPRPVLEPPSQKEIVMCWACGVTPQIVAMESKIPFMITHYPARMLMIDQKSEELAVF